MCQLEGFYPVNILNGNTSYVAYVNRSQDWYIMRVQGDQVRYAHSRRRADNSLELDVEAAWTGRAGLDYGKYPHQK